MDDPKKIKTEVARLSLGMYVTELDRPWEGTPFMLQGFLLDDAADIDKLMSVCKFVYIDRTKSIGDQFTAPIKQNVAIKREGAVIRVKDPGREDANKRFGATTQQLPVGKTSFLDVLRDLKNYQAPENVAPASQDGTIFNMKQGGAESAAKGTFQPTQTGANVDKKSITGDNSSGVGGFFSGLFKRNKLSTRVDKTTEDKETDDSYRVTLYEEEPPVENEIAAIYPVYEKSQVATREIFDAIANEQNLDLTAVSEILDTMVESIGRTPDALLWLSKLKQTNDYAYNHALQVSITAMAFGNFLALSKKQIKDIGLAGLLQDIGKVKLASDIMLKKGKLTHEEFEYSKKHVEEGLKILENTPDIPLPVIFMVAQHHERIDGSGYPNQLRESQISLTSQITGLIDTYCAITTNKTYSKGVYHQEALNKIHQLSGKQFSTELVDQLVQFMGMYPVSSLVELNTHEVGVVIQQNQVRRLLPRVMLLLGPDKSRYNAPVVINLLTSPASPSGEPYRIVKSLPPDSYGLNPDDFFM